MDKKNSNPILLLLLLLTVAIPEIITVPYQLIIPDKSPNDKRQYQALTLSNQMKVLFIQDQEVEKSVYTVSINAGSMYNPPRSLGLAHFLEHMLFLGSQKYPIQSSYENFISQNSGDRNGFTSDTQTWYYLQVKNSAFAEGVDRLTDFFVSPLLKKDGVQRQRQAVHNQFSLYVGNDAFRQYQALLELASPPYSQFTVGNSQTLAHKDIYEDLTAFFKTYYSSNIMNAVFYSKMPIEEMKKAFIPLLEKIPNRNTVLPKFGEHYTKQQRGKFVRMESIKDEKYIKFIWMGQLFNKFYNYKVNLYLNKVLCSKGKGSLFEILKNKKYVLKIQCDIYDQLNSSFIELKLGLTQFGFENYVQVYKIIEDYPRYLKASKSLYNEIKEINTMKFDYKEKQKPTKYSISFLDKMYKIPLHELITTDIIFQDFQKAESIINRYLSQLVPENSIVILSAKHQLKDPKIEKYTLARYSVEPLPIVNFPTQFQQIPSNPYLPFNITMLKFNNKLIPEKINEQFYLLQDSSFGIPQGGIDIKFFTNEAPEFMDFFMQYLSQIMQEIIEPATQIDADITFLTDMNIRIFGFSDTVIKLVKKVFTELDNLKKRQGNRVYFQVALQKIIDGKKNIYNERQDAYAFNEFKTIITKDIKTTQSILKQLSKYTFQNTKERIKNMLENMVIKWVAVGNFQRNQIIKLVDNYTKKGPKSKIYELSRTLFIERNITYTVQLKSKEMQSSCTNIYYQIGPHTEQLYYKLLLIKNYVDGPFFNELRTVRQLAYLLGIKIEGNRGILGLRFVLVSSSHNPQAISDQIRSFLDKFFTGLIDDLKKNDFENFKKIKQSIFTSLSQPHKNLKSLLTFIAAQISYKTFFFRRKQPKLINSILDKITVESLSDLWQKIKKYSVQIHIVSETHSQSYKNATKQRTVYTSIDKIKEDNKNYWRDMQYCCNW